MPSCVVWLHAQRDVGPRDLFFLAGARAKMMALCLLPKALARSLERR